MSHVSLMEIGFNERYYFVRLFGEFESDEEIKDNLEQFYIAQQESDKLHKKPKFPIGVAYRKILKEARLHAGRGKYIISKRQVANLIKVYDNDGNKYVKIPYTVDYIFKALFLIMSAYIDEGKELPDNIRKLYGQIRRTCFYDKQSDSFKRVCADDNRVIIKHLNQDLNSANCSLGKVFRYD